MPALTFASYLLYSYIILPLAYTSLAVLYTKRYEICPLVRCVGPLTTCLREPSCQTWLNAVAECSDDQSPARTRSAATFAHVQHPEDAAYCQYQSFDSIQSPTALEFLECIGRSGCIKPAEFSDTCADLSHLPDNSILPMETTVPPNVLRGTWHKLYTTGWDLWPCQQTDFWPPAADEDSSLLAGSAIPPSPDSWMTHWPNTSDVWRMDLYWQNPPSEDESSTMIASSNDSPFTFHMNNEMYFAQTWNFSSASSSSTPPPANTTLKTRAVMWGTEAHENWYLLDYHEEWQTMLIYYCAHTEAVDRFDSMAMVLKKKQDTTSDESAVTQEQAAYYERRARELLGERHGNLQRISSCERNKE
jgi:hypothetical protein